MSKKPQDALSDMITGIRRDITSSMMVTSTMLGDAPPVMTKEALDDIVRQMKNMEALKMLRECPTAKLVCSPEIAEQLKDTLPPEKILSSQFTEGLYVIDTEKMGVL